MLDELPPSYEIDLVHKNDTIELAHYEGNLQFRFRWMRKCRNFPTDLESVSHDSPENVWDLIFENETKALNLKQIVTTKFRKTA